MPFKLSIARFTALLTVLLSAAIAITDPLASDKSSAALALTVLTIGFWASGIIAEYLAALLFFTLAMLFAVVPAEVAFAGFSAGATWLIFSGLVIGVAVNASGLGERLARRLSILFGRSYRRVIFGIILVTLVLGFVMPSSMGRVMLVMPIAIALAKELGYDTDSRGYAGIVLAAGFGCFFMPYGILPANIPNVVLLGIAERLHDFSPVYGEWFALHFPLISLFKAPILWALVITLFPASSRPATTASEQGAITAMEWRIAAILLVALLGWATDFLHQISPAWIGMAAAMLCMAPGFGNVGKKDFGNINFSVLFYVAAILGIGAVVNHTGLGTIVAEHMMALLPLAPGQTFINYMSIALTGIAVGTFTAAPGIPIIMTPIAPALAEGSGFTLDAVLMIQALSFSTPYLVYQSAPIVVAMGMAGVRLADGTKLIALLALVTIVVIFPLDYFWWQMLGWF